MQITKVLGRKDGGSLALGILLGFLSLEAVQVIANYLGSTLFKESNGGSLKVSVLGTLVTLVIAVALIEAVLRLLNRKK